MRHLLPLLLLVTQAQASFKFINASATGAGSGADWANAYTDFSHAGSWSAGVTNFVAGGTYGQITPQGNGSFAAPTYFIRARATNVACADAVGWSGGLDATVTINGSGADSILFNNPSVGNNVIFDGQIPYSGIKVVAPNNNNMGIKMNVANTNYAYYNVEVAGPGGSSPFTYGGDNAGIGIFSSNEAHNGFFDHCAIHGCVTLVESFVSNVTIQHCKLYDVNVANASTYHPNVWQSGAGTNDVFRWNEVYNWDAEGIMMYDFTQSRWYIYGNLWHDCVSGSTARVIESQNNINGPVFFYNNTVANVTHGALRANSGTWASGCMAINNIFYNSSSGDDFGNGQFTAANQITSASLGVFTRNTGTDYHIVGTVGAGFPRQAGQTLGSPYDLDLDGVQRGNDGAWAIGAYEYLSSQTNTISISSGSLVIRFGQ